MSVNMRTEMYAFLFDGSLPGEGKHLEPAGIGKNRLLTGHKGVQTAHLIDDSVSRP